MVKFLFDIGCFVVGIVTGSFVGKYSREIYYRFFTKEEDERDFEVKNYEIICKEDDDECECEDDDET